MELALLLIISALVAASEQSSPYLITVPSVVHVGVEETVTVRFHEATKPVTITLYFQHKDKDLSRRQTVTLNEENSFQAVVRLKVEAELYKDVKYPTGIRPYANLVAQGPGVLQTAKTARCLLSTRKGYIFIQTDKPIYNPGETANFRIFTLDNYMRPTDESITLNIFNSKGLMVYRGDVKSEQIYERHVKIPGIEQAGHWKIVSFFTNLPMSNASVEFEVREYVLPSFEVKIVPAKKYLLLKDESFRFNVSARYTYGKGVNGIAYVRFGIIDEQGNKTFLPGLEKQTTIQQGSAEIALLTTDLRGKAESLNTAIEDRHIYIAVTALETASGELEEAEISSVKIVNSPYTIDLSKTKKYFTPGGIFSILATTTYPDGTPASRLSIKASVQVSGASSESIQLQGHLSNDRGEVALPFKVPGQAQSLDIKVFAEGEDEGVVASDALMTATATLSDSKSYLSVEVPHAILQKDGEMKVTFRDITPPGQNRPAHIYYMILSKGKVVLMNKVQRSEVTSVRLPFSRDMVPAFRIVAYYFRSSTEIVADSVWVDVQDVCEGEVKIQPFEGDYKPGSNVNVKVQTDQAEKVALVAVDTAVYILNKRNKLTSRKMFDYMNSYDLACSQGGGKDHLSVFTDAGLTFISSFGETPKVNDLSCHSVRLKRSASRYSQEFSAIVNKYNRPETRRCCNDGARLNRRMSCEQRRARTLHQSPACQEIFLKCCVDATALRERMRKASRKHSLGRSGVMDDLDVLNEANIRLRSYFPQSWMWRTHSVGPSGDVSHHASLPDSITTWEIQAVGLSKKNGFCVAEPQKLKVFQDFFVALKLPYSVKRNEQLEVKAVVYNYKTETLQVTVKMAAVDGLCTAGGEKDTQLVGVPGNSAVPVYFTVVPLKVGKIRIQVTAYADRDTADQIKKFLTVEGEGEIATIQKQFNIQARGDMLEIDVPQPPDAVPGLESEAFMSLKGGLMGESAENCLNLEGINKLIVLPTGCAEQTMSTLSPTIHAMKYLDATDQWLYLSPDLRDKAKSWIQSGYIHAMTYMRPDGSYGSFVTTPYSVWLTAFITKELTRIRGMVAVEDSYIQRSVAYLVSKQKSNGAFADPHPVSNRYLQGEGGGSEGEVSLTAYVLATMVPSMPVYSDGEGTETSIAIIRATDYLEQRLDSLKRPFVLAITAYALSMVSPESASARRARSKLKDLAQCDEAKDTCHLDVSVGLTGPGSGRASAVSVEMTAYALQASLKGGDLNIAKKFGRWLTEQRQYGGGFRSTQDTVVALEALAELSTAINDVDDLDLSVEVCLSKDEKERVHLTKRNALTQPSFKVTPGKKVTVDVKGKGHGTLSLLQTYRSMKRTSLYCDHYHLNISLEGEVAYKESRDEETELDDYYNYEAEEEAREEPMDRVEWFDLRTRRKRHASAQPEREATLIYSACVSVNGRNSTGMAIVDISLLSGLEPNIQDLEDQVKGTERYIDHYDLGKNKVYLYFSQITESTDCVTFRAKQITPIGLVQPASAVIYDYYNPERRCSVFYNAPQKSTMLSKLCSGDVCACAEGPCPKTKVTFSMNMKEDTRKNYACFSPLVNYMYMVKVLDSTEDGVFRYYTVTVTRVLQIGKDGTIQENAVRELIQQKSCSEFEMKDENEYLIMGKASTITPTLDAGGNFRYILNNEVWVEAIPEKKKCQATRNRKACQLLNSFIEQYEIQQCAV